MYAAETAKKKGEKNAGCHACFRQEIWMRRGSVVSVKILIFLSPLLSSPSPSPSLVS